MVLCNKSSKTVVTSTTSSTPDEAMDEKIEGLDLPEEKMKNLGVKVGVRVRVNWWQLLLLHCWSSVWLDWKTSSPNLECSQLDRLVHTRPNIKASDQSCVWLLQLATRLQQPRLVTDNCLASLSPRYHSATSPVGNRIGLMITLTSVWVQST